MRTEVLQALAAESERLARVMADRTQAERHRPTGCPPWDVAQLFGHVHVVLAWLPGMLDAEAGGPAAVSAADYYRPDGRFSSAADHRRIRLGCDHVLRFADAGAQASAFQAMVVEVLARCTAQPADRVVLTRHGDAMLLDDFLTTRVLEVGVHGLDLAAALGREPWLTPAAGAHLRRFLLPGADDPVAHLGDAQVLAAATGRTEVPPPDRLALSRAAVRLRLG